MKDLFQKRGYEDKLRRPMQPARQRLARSFGWYRARLRCGGGVWRGHNLQYSAEGAGLEPCETSSQEALKYRLHAEL